MYVCAVPPQCITLFYILSLQFLPSGILDSFPVFDRLRDTTCNVSRACNVTSLANPKFSTCHHTLSTWPLSSLDPSSSSFIQCNGTRRLSSPALLDRPASSLGTDCLVFFSIPPVPPVPPVAIVVAAVVVLALMAVLQVPLFLPFARL